MPLLPVRWRSACAGSSCSESACSPRAPCNRAVPRLAVASGGASWVPDRPRASALARCRAEFEGGLNLAWAIGTSTVRPILAYSTGPLGPTLLPGQARLKPDSP